MFHDLDRGRPLELRWLSGGVADLGAAAGVPTPANSAVEAVLILHADGRAVVRQAI
jgi:2-dehydropantoate 2-reductase